MTPEEKRLDRAKARLMEASIRFSEDLRGVYTHNPGPERDLLCAAMDYAETVHFVEWSRAKQAEERDKRLSET